MNILIIDDSKAVHAFVSEILSVKNHAIEHAYNGQEGLDKVLSKKENYDLILLDWEMPVLTGPQTLARIKQEGLLIPIIMMTSKNAVADIQSMMELGAAEYIIKPFTKDIFTQKISFVLGGQEV